MLTPERRAHLSSIARLGGLAASATTDTIARARAGQSKLRQSFADGHGCSLCPHIAIPNDLPEDERARRATALWKGHFSRLARQ